MVSSLVCKVRYFCSDVVIRTNSCAPSLNLSFCEGRRFYSDVLNSPEGCSNVAYLDLSQMRNSSSNETHLPVGAICSKIVWSSQILKEAENATINQQTQAQCGDDRWLRSPSDQTNKHLQPKETGRAKRHLHPKECQAPSTTATPIAPGVKQNKKFEKSAYLMTLVVSPTAVRNRGVARLLLENQVRSLLLYTSHRAFCLRHMRVRERRETERDRAAMPYHGESMSC